MMRLTGQVGKNSVCKAQHVKRLGAESNLSAVPARNTRNPHGFCGLEIPQVNHHPLKKVLHGGVSMLLLYGLSRKVEASYRLRTSSCFGRSTRRVFGADQWD